MKTHIFDFCATIKSEKDFDDLTGEEFRQALLNRIKKMDVEEFTEACGHVETEDEEE